MSAGGATSVPARRAHQGTASRGRAASFLRSAVGVQGRCGPRLTAVTAPGRRRAGCSPGKLFPGGGVRADVRPLSWLAIAAALAVALLGARAVSARRGSAVAPVE